MSENRHTRGPWKFVSNSWETSTVYGLNGAAVAECNIDPDADEETQHFFEERKDADARLIAAAPDLLAALQSIVLPDDTHRLDLEMTNSRISFAEMRAIRAAIQKAVALP